MTAALAIAYLLGSIPTGLLLTRPLGLDPRRLGSGNIGATNVARVGGARLGALTLLGDAGKGVVATLVGRALGGPAAAAAAGLAAVVGHVFPVWLGFRGGKGVATAAGALLVLDPASALLALVVFALVLRALRWVSLASLAATWTAALAVWLHGGPLVAVVAIACLVSVRHRDNVRRLRAGTEPRLGAHR